MHVLAQWRANRHGVDLAESKAHQRKEPPRVLGGSGVHAAFLAAVESGETGIRTLGTREGTPVFKTGAIGRSAISPGRMLGGAAVCVNIPGLLLVEFSPGW